ncbi:MAG: DUF503 domain-containing protein [Clostridiales bacterium]|nr:DUF503 domain-containing protein [Clostridiales bacterium]
MFIAAVRVEILLYESQSLKEKRQVLKSLITKVQNQFNVSVAEVDYLDSWRRAALGLAFVANGSVHAEKQMDRALDFIDDDPRYEIINIHKEVI